MNRRTFLMTTAAGAAATFGPKPGAAREQAGGTVDQVSVGIVGLGNRGTYLMRVLMQHPQVRVAALCDLNEEHLTRAVQVARDKQGHAPAGYTKDPNGYGAMLERDELDAILVATPTKWHCPMAVQAMKAGKHVGSEVPAGFHLDELWELVRTKEATGKRYMLLENYLYSREHMAVLNMVRAGCFGDPYYAECAYIHDCRFMLFKDDGSLDWWGRWASRYYGHDYPTHGTGPVSKWMRLNEGDRMTHCCAMMSTPRVLERYTRRQFGPDSEQAKIKWANGDFTSVMIRTHNGRLIRSDYDVNSPRPMSNYYLLQGTRGVYDSRQGIHFEGGGELWRDFQQQMDQYDHSYWREDGERARRTGHGGGDFFVLRDFVNMIRDNREPWIDVYDAATWSAIYHCSKKSIDNNGGSVEMPDFTDGRWKETDWRRDHMRPA